MNYCITENYRGKIPRVIESYSHFYNKVKTLVLHQPYFLTYWLTWEHHNTACYTVNTKEDQPDCKIFLNHTLDNMDYVFIIMMKVFQNTGTILQYWGLEVRIRQAHPQFIPYFMKYLLDINGTSLISTLQNFLYSLYALKWFLSKNILPPSNFNKKQNIKDLIHR